MHTTDSTSHRSVTVGQSLRLGLASGTLGLALGVAILSLVPARPGARPHLGEGAHPPAVGAALNDEPAAAVSIIGPQATVIDSTAASQLAAENPWANANRSPTGDALGSPRLVSVDGATASRLAALHPWATTNSRQVYTVTGAARATIRTVDRATVWPHYAFVQVDGALASRLAAEHPWLGVAFASTPTP